MGDISKDFNRSEHACNCGCGFDTVDVELNHILQVHLRDYYQKKVTLNGNRCPYWNEHEDGSDNSYHMQGKAADTKVEDVSPMAVYTYLSHKFPDRYGLILYATFVHIDVRPDRYRKIM